MSEQHLRDLHPVRGSGVPLRLLPCDKHYILQPYLSYGCMSSNPGIVYSFCRVTESLCFKYSGLEEFPL